MFIRGRVALQEQRREAASEHRPPKKTTRRREEENLAALKIQSIWRGRRERRYIERRRGRSKPWGYYTHTVDLTYIHSVRKQRVPRRQTIYRLLEDPSSSTTAFVLSLVNIGTIILSIGCFMLETMPEVYHSVSRRLALQVLEVLCTLLFTAEYCCRLAVCTSGGTSHFRFVISPMNAVDLVALMPFYLEVLMRSGGFVDTLALRLARLVRLVRLARILKLSRYASGMRLVGAALKHSTQAVSVLVFLLSMGVVLFSSALFHLERLSCPQWEDLDGRERAEYSAECADDYNRGVSPTYGLCCTEGSAPNDFPSIIAASWWSMTTMTSVGYGEVYPRTTQGKCVGFVAMLVGMVLIALPVAIVGQKFQDVFESHDLDEAKFRAVARMRSDGKVWAVVPSTDVLQRLRQLKLQDPAVGASVASLAAALESTWEQRERLGRERRYLLERHQELEGKTQELLKAMLATSRGQQH
mmetsp:Transcript_35674/g.113373  ORF Transcript_35674/g.113373 Transcript_35674/m.113373 type:complete len:470 (+) Transcript_35674:65-1474(+)